MQAPQTSQFTIGKLDAGIAVLLGESSHLVEFPSVLLPQGCKPGSIVTIACQRNQTAEQEVARAFWDLQDRILDTFGKAAPEAPVLKLRNVTQTSVALEWEPLKLASSKLVSLAIWRNNQRVALIPNPTSNLSTKMSGLELDAPYSFHLVLQTTAGCYQSNIVKTRTHKLDNTTGVRVCFGNVQPPELLEACHEWLEQMGGGTTDTLQIDTTHFVCTGPGSSPTSPSGSQLYQRALQMSIPTVTPAWLEACVSEKRLAAVKNFVLGKSSAQPSYRRSGSASASKASLGSTRQTAAAVQPPAAQTQEQTASTSTPPSAPPAESTPHSQASETTPSSDATALPPSGQDAEESANADKGLPLEESREAEAAQESKTEESSGVELQTPVETPVEGEGKTLDSATTQESEDSSKRDDADSAGDMEDVKL